jgi:PTS system nitrogen regulatory IIA component
MVRATLDVAAFFKPEYFVPELKSRSKDGILKELAGALVKTGLVKDGELVLEMLRAREALGSTGIGKGVAIPHGRSLAVSSMVVLFARSSRGVLFDAVDGKPVHLFFLIVAPPNDRANLYLPFLGRLVEVLKSKKSRDRLLAASGFDDVAEVLKTDHE